MEEKTTPTKPIRLTTTKDSVFSNDYSYYGDSMFRGQNDLLTFLIKKYDKDTCVPMVYEKKNLREGFEGFKNLGDINNDNNNDSVFVLQPLNWCEYDDGESYYFTDTTLPRLKSGSSCCHPTNFFKTADIDEDGICEVGFFYSTCVSRYKSLQVYRLKNSQWEQIATADFDVLTQDPEKVKLEDFVRKISKDKFQIKNFIEGKKYWDTISIK
jgi:hypothetical protein